MPVTLSQPVRQCNASAIPLGDDQASRRLRSAPVWPMARTVAFAPRPEDDHPWRTRESVAEGDSDARSQRIRDAPNTILDDEGRRNQPIERSGAFPVHFRCRIGNRPQRLPALPAWETGPSPLPNRRFARWQRSRPAPPCAAIDQQAWTRSPCLRSRTTDADRLVGEIHDARNHRYRSCRIRVRSDRTLADRDTRGDASGNRHRRIRCKAGAALHLERSPSPPHGSCNERSFS